jgi:hypothetical protein
MFRADGFAPAAGHRQERKEKRDRATGLTLSEIAHRERFRALTTEETAARSRLVAREMAVRWREENPDEWQRVLNQKFSEKVSRKLNLLPAE